nr:DNA-directed RNA polymerase III subunit RPC4 [Parasteatoda tepidariorum]
MSELPPPGKHPDLSGLPRGAISIRGLPLGRNTRLPSIRSPRDLTLGAQPKRVFTPNIPVRREKKSVESEPEKSQTSTSKSKEPKQKPSFSPKWQKKERTIIQTEGSLFGEGIAASPSKNERPREAVPKFTSKRPAVKKEFDMSEMKSDLNGILRDDFIDDDDEYDEDDDVKPIIYPCHLDAEKIKKEIPPKKKFEDEEFAKGLGFDVERIAKFIKKEKCADAAIKQDEVNMDLESDNEIYNLIKQDKHQLFLLQFPKFFAVEQAEDQQKDSLPEQKKVNFGFLFHASVQN